MIIRENRSAALNEKVLLYDCFNDENRIIATVHIDLSKNMKDVSVENDDNQYSWNVWVRIECYSIKDYFELKSNKEIKKEIEQKIKEYIWGEERKKIKIKMVVYPHSDDPKVKEAAIKDINNTYSVITENDKNIVIDEYEI